MCTTCGCSDDQNITIDGQPMAGHVHDHDHSHDHSHSHSHSHSHEHSHSHDHVGMHTHGHSHGTETEERGEIIRLEQNLLAKNDHIAAHNRDWFAERQILALNLLGSPGAGKTTLLERTLSDIGAKLSCSVIEGDQATQHDAERIREAGGKAVQVNTGPGCHLEADMIASSLSELSPDPSSIVFLENVGNLVCPALFDLGESKRVVLLSITEGEDKPLKYPHMFRSADLVLLHKSDLLPHLNFNIEKCMDFARQVKPGVEILQISSTTGEGMQAWYDWLRQQRTELFASQAGSDPIVSKGESL